MECQGCNMNTPPSPNGSNGRGIGGRFSRGNSGGPGNPYAKRVAELRSALLDTVTPDDMKEVISALLRQAKSGDVAAIKELMQRLLGPPVEADLIARIESLEAHFGKEVDGAPRPTGD